MNFRICTGPTALNSCLSVVLLYIGVNIHRNDEKKILRTVTQPDFNIVGCVQNVSPLKCVDFS